MLKKLFPSFIAFFPLNFSIKMIIFISKTFFYGHTKLHLLLLLSLQHNEIEEKIKLHKTGGDGKKIVKKLMEKRDAENNFCFTD